MSKVDCLQTVNFFKEKERLTKHCKIPCYKCPLSLSNNGTQYGCEDLIQSDIEKAVEILQRWSDENPVKTRLDDFKEKYPNHTTCGKDYPHTCCLYLGYTKECDNDCCECWNMPL